MERSESEFRRRNVLKEWTSFRFVLFVAERHNSSTHWRSSRPFQAKIRQSNDACDCDEGGEDGNDCANDDRDHPDEAERNKPVKHSWPPIWRERLLHDWHADRCSRAKASARRGEFVEALAVFSNRRRAVRACDSMTAARLVSRSTVNEESMEISESNLLPPLGAEQSSVGERVVDRTDVFPAPSPNWSGFGGVVVLCCCSGGSNRACPFIVHRS